MGNKSDVGQRYSLAMVPHSLNTYTGHNCTHSVRDVRL